MASIAAQFNDLPLFVQRIKITSAIGELISWKDYERCVTEYAEYFPEETAQRKNWEAIPQHVHDAYDKDFSALVVALEIEYPNPHKGKGLMFYARNPDKEAELIEVNRIIEAKTKALEKREKLLIKKHYGPYEMKASK